MTYRANYPRSVAEVLRDDATFRPGTVAAIKRFRAAKPWRGSLEEREAKLRVLFKELARVYRIPEPGLLVRPGAVDCYFPGRHCIQLDGRVLSVVTALHEFGHALGKDEEQTCRWSINLFRRFFPRSYAALRHEGHTLRRAR